MVVLSGSFPESPEVEPNDRVQDATPVVVPVACSGKFDAARDVDGYRFQAQAGQRLVLEIQASRLGSPVDTYITLMNRSGQVVGRDDDGGGMPDARLELTVPTTDEYVAFVRNQTRSGFGPQYFYNLTIRTLQPRFTGRLRMDGQNERGEPAKVPVDSVAVPPGGQVEFEVELSRTEGQNGDVTVALNAPPSMRGLRLEQVIREQVRNPALPPEERDLPRNLIERVRTLPTAVVKNGQNSITVRLTAAPDAPVGTHMNIYLKMSGTAGAQPHVVDRPLWLTIAPRS